MLRLADVRSMIGRCVCEVTQYLMYVSVRTCATKDMCMSVD